MIFSREKGVFLGPYNLGLPHFWTTKLYMATETCKKYAWFNGIATSRFEPVYSTSKI